MKFYIQRYQNINRCLLTFGENCSTGGTLFLLCLFMKCLGCAYFGFKPMRMHKNSYASYVLLEITMIQFGQVQLSRGFFYSVFLKSFLIVLSRILLHGIVQNFALSILTFKDDIDIIFESIACQGALQSQFSSIFLGSSGKSHKKIMCNIYIITSSNYTI